MLLGCRFTVLTDHRSLQHFLSQKNLSPRQARWLEYLSEFDFIVKYIPGTTNVLADALSRIYAEDRPGIVRAESEYLSTDTDLAISLRSLRLITSPVDVIASLDAESDDSSASINLFAARKSWKSKGKAKASESPENQSAVSEDPPAAHKKLPRVFLRVSDPNETLKGGSTTTNSVGLNTEKSIEDSSNLKTTEIVQSEEPVVVQEESDTNNTLETSRSQRDKIDWDRELELTLQDEESMIGNDPVPAVPLTEVIHAVEPNMKFPDCIRGHYKDDKYFKVIAAKPSAFRNFEIVDNLMYLYTDGNRVLCILEIDINGKGVCMELIDHAHSLLVHLGARKTLQYLRENCWWKTMAKDVKKYCQSCHKCQISKSSNHAPYGLLKPLPIPLRPWETIRIDFVGPLPESKNRLGNFDMIITIIDHLTSMVHLVPSVSTYRAKDVAELIFENVYKLYGLPINIVSDRDSLFTSQFWEKLHELIGTNLKMSSSFHP